MTNEDFANIIRLARRAPLANMDEAEAAAMLLQKFAAFVMEYKPPVEKKKRANGHDRADTGKDQSDTQRN